jgi:hypothetical protein
MERRTKTGDSGKKSKNKETLERTKTGDTGKKSKNKETLERIKTRRQCKEEQEQGDAGKKTLWPVQSLNGLIRVHKTASVV